MTDGEIQNATGDGPSDGADADPVAAFFIQLDGLITWTGAVVDRALDAGSTTPLDEAISSIDEQLPRDWFEPQFDPLQDMWVAGPARHFVGRQLRTQPSSYRAHAASLRTPSIDQRSVDADPGG